MPGTPIPGLDDAAGSVEESLAIARSLVAEGVSVVAGTPHVRGPPHHGDGAGGPYVRTLPGVAAVS